MPLLYDNERRGILNPATRFRSYFFQSYKPAFCNSILHILPVLPGSYNPVSKSLRIRDKGIDMTCEAFKVPRLNVDRSASVEFIDHAFAGLEAEGT